LPKFPGGFLTILGVPEFITLVSPTDEHLPDHQLTAKPLAKPLNRWIAKGRAHQHWSHFKSWRPFEHRKRVVAADSNRH